MIATDRADWAERAAISQAPRPRTIPVEYRCTDRFGYNYRLTNIPGRPSASPSSSISTTTSPRSAGMRPRYSDALRHTAGYFAHGWRRPWARQHVLAVTTVLVDPVRYRVEQPVAARAGSARKTGFKSRPLWQAAQFAAHAMGRMSVDQHAPSPIASRRPR